ncbi:MAG: glutathione peroxidase [Bacteroidia bacterium]|nr:MAG: glutathione peroxidase [Bacteroidia bacterium]
MKMFYFFLAIPFIGNIFQNQPSEKTSIHQFKAKDIDGNVVDFSKFKGKKLLIVNTASECGFTPQYKDLETLYQKYKDKNFLIIAFPCNDFGGQEPGDAQQIKSFCQKNYGVSFLIMEKVKIKGDSPHPIYQWLTQKEKNGVKSSTVMWNFQKYLIDENGYLVDYYNSMVSPLSDKIVNWIEGKK